MANHAYARPMGKVQIYDFAFQCGLKCDSRARDGVRYYHFAPVNDRGVCCHSFDEQLFVAAGAREAEAFIRGFAKGRAIANRYV